MTQYNMVLVEILQIFLFLRFDLNGVYGKRFTSFTYHCTV